MFAAVLLQINLTDHRVMFRTYAYTFTTDEAAKVMSALVFIHIHRKPDPLDPSRQIATRTTTTFSMDYASAKNLLQQFLLAGLIMNSADPSSETMRDKGIWAPTLKGKYVLEEFADSTQVSMSSSLIAALNAPHMTSSSGSTGNRVIVLDRLLDGDDQITFSRANITAIFKAMTASLPREALIPDEFGGIEKRHIGIYQYTFLGQHCIEWLCERLTVNAREEADSVASEFVLFGWLAQILDKSDRSHVAVATNKEMAFNTARNSIYYVTDRGCAVIGWKIPNSEEVNNNSSSSNSVHSETSLTKRKPEVIKMTRQDSGTAMQSSLSQGSTLVEPTTDAKTSKPARPASMSISDSALSHVSAMKDSSQWARLMLILETPLMRMYFRDFLRSNYCAENMNFWVDHHKLLKNKDKKTVIEQLAECYVIYETYLGPSAPADVNIDHTLHQEMVKYVNGVFVVVSQLPLGQVKIPYFVAPANQQAAVPVPVKPTKTANRLLLMPPQANAKQKIVTIRGVHADNCLAKMLSLFAKVNELVCLMMAEDSVPKFVKTEKYKELVLKLQQQKESDEEEDEDDDNYSFEDSSDDDEKSKLNTITTSFSDQRSIMVPQRQKAITNVTSL
jgi:hypothetical protein